MRRERFPSYEHRFLDDHLQIHSYCLKCFANVAISTSLHEVRVEESHHRCDPLVLELVRQYKREFATLSQPLKLRIL